MTEYSWVEHAFRRVDEPESQKNCHSERSEEAQPTNAVEESAVSTRRSAFPLRNDPQVPPLGLKPPVGMTIRSSSGSMHA
jgi:hypothetical protein